MSDTPASLFSDLSAIRTATVKVALQPGQNITDPQSGNTIPVPLPGSKPVVFEIHQISPNELLEADAVLDAAKPPALTRRESRPGTQGLTEVHDGYDFDHPDYVASRGKLLPVRSAAICLYGCKALMDSTPGSTIAEKACNLNTSVPASIIEWLRDQIETLAFFVGVGEEEVARFLAGPSGAADGSGSSKRGSRRERKS